MAALSPWRAISSEQTPPPSSKQAEPSQMASTEARLLSFVRHLGIKREDATAKVLLDIGIDKPVLIAEATPKEMGEIVLCLEQAGIPIGDRMRIRIVKMSDVAGWHLAQASLVEHGAVALDGVASEQEAVASRTAQCEGNVVGPKQCTGRLSKHGSTASAPRRAPTGRKAKKQTWVDKKKALRLQQQKQRKDSRGQP